MGVNYTGVGMKSLKNNLYMLKTLWHVCPLYFVLNILNSCFSGFGVAITGASCYELSTMSEEARDKFLCDIYGTDGINLSVGRLSI